uniref:Uncharacterized protein n=1 Tax=Triticum urartu TaxID=4572 RepID=A0A8R7JZM7_TRIUA
MFLETSSFTWFAVVTCCSNQVTDYSTFQDPRETPMPQQDPRETPMRQQ